MHMRELPLMGYLKTWNFGMRTQRLSMNFSRSSPTVSNVINYIAHADITDEIERSFASTTAVITSARACSACIVLKSSFARLCLQMHLQVWVRFNFSHMIQYCRTRQERCYEKISSWPTTKDSRSRPAKKLPPFNKASFESLGSIVNCATAPSSISVVFSPLRTVTVAKLCGNEERDLEGSFSFP